MVRASILLLFAALLSFPATSAVAEVSSKEGLMEFGAFGTINQTTVDMDGEDLITESGTASISVGYFITKNIEVGLRYDAQSSSVQWRNDTTETLSMLWRGFASFNIPTSGNVMPYVGVGIGMGIEDTESDQSTDITLYGPFGGLKVFPDDRMAFLIQASYELATYDYPDGSSYDAGALVLSLGLVIYMGMGK